MSKTIKYTVVRNSEIIKNWEFILWKDENINDKILMSLVEDIQNGKHKEILDELIKSDSYVLNKLKKLVTITYEK